MQTWLKVRVGVSGKAAELLLQWCLLLTQNKRYAARENIDQSLPHLVKLNSRRHRRSKQGRRPADVSVKQPGRGGRDWTGATSSADPGIDVVRRGAGQAGSQSVDKAQQHAVAVAADAKARFNLNSARKKEERARLCSWRRKETQNRRLFAT